MLDLDAPEIITKLLSESDDKDVDITSRLNENLTSSSPVRAVQEFLCQGHLAQETEAWPLYRMKSLWRKLYSNLRNSSAINHHMVFFPESSEGNKV